MSSTSTSPEVIFNPPKALRSVLITPEFMSIPSPAVKAAVMFDEIVTEPFALFTTVILSPPCIKLVDPSLSF